MNQIGCNEIFVWVLKNFLSQLNLVFLLWVIKRSRKDKLFFSIILQKASRHKSIFIWDYFNYLNLNII